jgi:hypothetical protein
MTFGQLRLSIKGTNNGRGFDIFYDFGKSLNFVEFTSKPEFYFIQPWMQFPSDEYTDTCKLVSIELVRRFNEFPILEQRSKSADEGIKKVMARERDIIERARTEMVAYHDALAVHLVSHPEDCVCAGCKLVRTKK